MRLLARAKPAKANICVSRFALRRLEKTERKAVAKANTPNYFEMAHPIQMRLHRGNVMPTRGLPNGYERVRVILRAGMCRCGHEPTYRVYVGDANRPDVSLRQ